MSRYEPAKAPDPDQWLNTPEADRIDLVTEYHARADELLPAGAGSLHSTLHVIVENQIAMGLAPVPEVVARLIREGLSRHDAIHAIGAVLLDLTGGLISAKGASWDSGEYEKRLTELTAKRWLKGQW